MTGGLPLVLTPGMGIGPEVSVRAIERLGVRNIVVLGRASALEQVDTAIEWARIDSLEERPTQSRAIRLLDPGDDSEPCEVASIRLAAELCLDGRAAGMVTGPIHKAQLRARGFRFSGHTDFLGHLCGAQPVMGFAGGALRVVLVTDHMPLMEVSAAITSERVEHTIRTAVASLRGDLGIMHPRVGVCGLNPHAAEQGILGHEDAAQIAPAVEKLQREGLDCRGPMGAESAFLAARSGDLDLVVAMYHDQGLAPLKAVDFGRSVNWSMGLPILRVSVDHGTADDLVGTGKADPASMVAAIELARQILSHRAAGS